MDVQRFLNTRPKKFSSARQSSESDAEIDSSFPKNKILDFDPEDVDQENLGDNTAATVQGLGKRQQSREHYGDILATQSGALKKIKNSKDLASNYVGVPVTRSSLGLETGSRLLDHQITTQLNSDAEVNSEDTSDSFDECRLSKSGDSSIFASEDDENSLNKMHPETNTLRDRLVEFKDDAASQIEIIQRRKMEDSDRGKAVLEQIKTWQDTLDLRITLQPILKIVRDHRLLRDPDVEKQALEILLELTGLFCESIRCPEDDRVSLEKIGKFAEDRIWRPNLDTWHRKANIFAPNGGGMGGASVSRAKLKVIDQGPFAQIEIALRDIDRLIARTCTRRGVVESSVENLDMPFIDDGDFYQLLLRESIANPHDAMIAAKNVAKPAKNISGEKKVDRAPSKGKAMRFDVHEKLIGFMAPLGDMAFSWPVERVSAFFDSVFP